MLDHPPIGEDVEDAASVTMAVCKCPHVHIVLFDQGDRAFARALVTPEQLATMVRDVENALGHPLPQPKLLAPQSFGHG